MKVFRFLLSITVLAALLSAQPTLGYANTPPIDQGYNSRIIDDNKFLNSGSMSVAEIQSFLNSKVPTCDTNHQGGLAAYPPPYTCLKDYTDPTTGKKAAQLIYDEATSIGLNPQVVLVTLEKEQGLVSDTWPYPSQYKSAMGYGCPETQSVCDSQYYGFYNQVHLGARLLRAGAARDCGDTSTLSGWQIDPKWRLGKTINLDGRSTYLGTCATGSLYNYTPHRPDSAYTLASDGNYYYGNYNFVNFYSKWFGATTSGALAPDISLVSSSTTGKVYIITNGNKYFVPVWDLLIAYHLDGYAVTSVTDNFLSGLGTEGDGNLTNLINDNGAIYLVDSGKRYHVPSSDRCTQWGLDCFNAQVVKFMSPNFIARIPASGELPQVASSHGVVYKMDQGNKNPIYDAQTFLDLGFNWGQVISIQDYTAVKPYGPLQISHDAVLTLQPNSPIFLYDSNDFQFHQIPSMNEFNAWGLGKAFSGLATTSSYTQAPPAAGPALSDWAYDSDGKMYLIDNGRKINVTAQSGKLPTTVYNNFARQILSKLPELVLGSAVQSPDGGVYVLDSGTKRHVDRYSDFVNLGLTPSNTTGISNFSASLIPTGAVILADGSTFGTQNGIFVVNGSNKLHVPNMNYFSLMNLDYSVYTASGQTETAYSGNDQLSSFYKMTDGSAWSAHGDRYLITAANAAAWGIQTTSWTTLTNNNANKSNPNREFGSLVITDSGGIYYGSGGQRHHVLSYYTYTQLCGGNYSKAVKVSDEFLAQSPAGSDLP